MINFYKQCVVDGNPVQYKAIKALAYMCFGLAALMLLLGDYIPALVIIIVGIAAFYFKKYLLVSFEYEISEGKISIEKIIDNKNGNKVFTFSISDIMIMAPETSGKIKEMKIRSNKTLKLYPKTYLKGIYTVIVKSGEKIIKVKIVPDSKFIEMCQKLNKTKIIKE